MSARERAQALADVLKFNDDILMVGLTDMPDTVARKQLRADGPSVAWNVGHMLHHRNQIAKAIGCRGPAFDVSGYEGTATDGRAYPVVGEFRAEWNDFSSRLVAAIARLTPEELAAPSPMPLPHGEQTLLDALRFIVWHEGLHLGQVALLRSQHGLTPLVTLIREREPADSM